MTDWWSLGQAGIDEGLRLYSEQTSTKIERGFEDLCARLRGRSPMYLDATDMRVVAAFKGRGGPWGGSTALHRLAATEVRAQTWHRVGSTAQVAQLGEAHLTDDATEILPGPLAEMARGGSSGACRWLAKRQGWMEQVVAYRLGEGRAVVLQARRRAGQEGGLLARSALADSAGRCRRGRSRRARPG